MYVHRLCVVPRRTTNEAAPREGAIDDHELIPSPSAIGASKRLSRSPLAVPAGPLSEADAWRCIFYEGGEPRHRTVTL